MLSNRTRLFFLFNYLFLFIASAFGAAVHAHGRSVPSSLSPELHVEASAIQTEEQICQNSALLSFYDYSAKNRSEPQLCPKDTLLARQVAAVEDYSCSESKPCKNGKDALEEFSAEDVLISFPGACCSKSSGFCGRSLLQCRLRSSRTSC
jgi:hypothetical protein